MYYLTCTPILCILVRFSGDYNVLYYYQFWHAKNVNTIMLSASLTVLWLSLTWRNGFRMSVCRLGAASQVRTTWGATLALPCQSTNLIFKQVLQVILCALKWWNLWVIGWNISPLGFHDMVPASLLALCLEHQLILLHSKFHWATICPWYYQSHSDILHEQTLSFLIVSSLVFELLKAWAIPFLLYMSSIRSWINIGWLNVLAGS